MDILEQLQSKITQTIQTLENLQLGNMELQEELEQLRAELATSQQQNADLQGQVEELQKEQVRLSHEKHENDARVESLLQALDGAVADLLPAADSADMLETAAQPQPAEQPLNNGFNSAPSWN
ncbi:hypothetical protein [Oceanobacter mangrovi]|uniref:hypothetical protein n=1 Tax=Oceanobacter mangrovi TaxID=2862510 RepID=UPI001C8ED989|nr:hypothetical protein [Oceanobacter mangrovi]